MALMPQLEDFRNVDFKVAGHWMIKFDSGAGVPAPFDNFLPVESVKEPLLSLEAKSIDVGFFNSSIPYASKSQNITIRFFDRSDNILLQWFLDWGKLLASDTHAAYVEDVVRKLSIYKYTSDHSSYVRSAYYVFPYRRS